MSAAMTNKDCLKSGIMEYGEMKTVKCSNMKEKDMPLYTVRRLSDGKILPVVDERGDEICVVEMFDFADGGPSPRPLKCWHPKSRYEIKHEE